MNIKVSLKVLLAKNSINVAQLAEHLGVSKQAIYGYMRQDVRMSTVEKLAEAFGMKVSEFIELGEQ